MNTCVGQCVYVKQQPCCLFTATRTHSPVNDDDRHDNDDYDVCSCTYIFCSPMNTLFFCSRYHTNNTHILISFTILYVVFLSASKYL